MYNRQRSIFPIVLALTKAMPAAGLLLVGLHDGRDVRPTSHRIRYGTDGFAGTTGIADSGLHLDSTTNLAVSWSQEDLFYTARRGFQVHPFGALLRTQRIATLFSPVQPHADEPPLIRAHNMVSLVVSLLIRLALVALFLPFSALDKVLNPGTAVDQAQGTVHSRTLAWILIGLGLFVEVAMSLAVISGVFDRLAAVILAGYCVVTALLWKQFWKADDFRLKGPSKGREVFWDFLKNLAVAGGFLILATGGTAQGVQHLITHPLSSSQPYAEAAQALSPQTGYSSTTSKGDSR